MTNAEKFREILTEELTEAVKQNPRGYIYGLDKVPTMIDTYMTAILRNTYNKDGAAFQATIKRLGLKNTYKAVNAFLA